MQGTNTVKLVYKDQQRDQQSVLINARCLYYT